MDAPELKNKFMISLSSFRFSIYRCFNIFDSLTPYDKFPPNIIVMTFEFLEKGSEELEKMFFERY